MQTTALEYPVRYRNGLITRNEGLITDTGVSESSSNILIGQTVIADTAKKGVDLPAAAFTLGAVYGVVGYEFNKAKNINANTITYADEDEMLIVRQGFVAITIADTIAKGANLFFVHTTGGASAIHTYRSDLDTDKASITPIRALEGGSSGDTIECYINVFANIGDTDT
jgi:hypothetical protein